VLAFCGVVSEQSKMMLPSLLHELCQVCVAPGCVKNEVTQIVVCVGWPKGSLSSRRLALDLDCANRTAVRKWQMLQQNRRVSDVAVAGDKAGFLACSQMLSAAQMQHVTGHVTA
jgi:hypothetical protein